MRPVDQEPDADLQGVSESVGDLEELRLVSTPGTSREVLLGEDELAPGVPRADSTSAALSGTLAYPEWDYRIGAYRGIASVRVESPRVGSGEWVGRTLAQHSATLNACAAGSKRCARAARSRTGSLKDTRHHRRGERGAGRGLHCARSAARALRRTSRHLPLVLGPGNYTIVRDAPQLAGALLEWLRAVAVTLQ